MASWKDRLALTAQRNRQEIVKAKLSRREMMRLGLLTAGGSLVLKKGLSARAFADQGSGGGSSGGGSLTAVQGVDGPPSPPATPWAQPMPILPVKTPVAYTAMSGGIPDGTTPIDGATARIKHQLFTYNPHAAPGTSPYDLGHDASKYPFERVVATAELASLLRPDAQPELKEAIGDNDSAVRYWAALGILMRGRGGFDAAAAEMRAALGDSAPPVRTVAAQALGQYGSDDDRKRALQALIELSDWGKHDVFTVMAALNALDALGARAAPVAGAVKALPAKGKVPDPRYAPYVPRLLEDLRASLK